MSGAASHGSGEACPRRIADRPALSEAGGSVVSALREEIAREARAAAADFADLTDDELLAREAELDQRWVTIREEHQRIFNERRKIKRETSRRGLFLPPIHDDDADSDASPREKLEAALAESKKRRQQRP
ncbi:hypothetical protein [Streptomyces sp. ISL-43]|uniref:hypothetical protein n=1 Tax=Streptomyces sp. ISL-43 TaxID=2819183 RepID=UPI002034FF4E|nr:hypothetical protein [Streptomyces sp. ISL-43]